MEIRADFPFYVEELLKRLKTYFAYIEKLDFHKDLCPF